MQQENMVTNLDIFKDLKISEHLKLATKYFSRRLRKQGR